VHIVAGGPEVRADAARLLSSHGYAVQVYADGTDFLRDARLDDGCILLDVDVPGIGGAAVQAELARRAVELPVIALTAAGDMAAAVRAMKAGAVDSLERPPREQELIPAIERVLASHGAAGDRRKVRIAAERRLDPLSPRKRQILQGLVAGLSNKAIARRLGLSPRTVEMHRANMMGDLGIDSLPEALRLAIDAGLPPLGPEGAGEPAPAGRGAPPSPGLAPEDRRHCEEKLRLVPDASGGGGRECSFPPEAAELLDLVLWGAGAGVWDYDVGARMIRLSRRSRILHGLAPDGPELVSEEQWAQAVHPDDLAGARAALAHAAASGERCSARFRTRTRDGGWRCLLALGKAVAAREGAPRRIVGLNQEVCDPEGDTFALRV
jgi:two-component system response regulator FixJ